MLKAFIFFCVLFLPTLAAAASGHILNAVEEELTGGVSGSSSGKETTAASSSHLRWQHDENDKETGRELRRGYGGSGFVRDGRWNAYGCEYQCPEFSNLKHGVGACPRSFQDCTCNSGYYKAENQECKKWCDYKCPMFSYRIPNRQCYDNFDDCRCFNGYKKDRSGVQACVKSCGSCPANSTPNKDCVLQVWSDCDCDAGYYMEAGQCVKWCGFQCPRRSYRDPNKSCHQSFHDCVCQPGFVKTNQRCARRKCIYQCPANSQAKTSCPQSFWEDCQCKNGYYPTSERRCDKWCDFDCDARNGYKNPNVGCHTTFDHCICKEGFHKDSDNQRCIRSF